MDHYPPKLVQVAATALGSLLTLSDGREIPIDISPDRLSEALAAHERPPLYELLEARSLDVFAATWAMTAGDWQRISNIIRASPIATVALHEVPSVWEVFGQPAAFVRSLPHRVYGGLARISHTA